MPFQGALDTALLDGACNDLSFVSSHCLLAFVVEALVSNACSLSSRLA